MSNTDTIFTLDTRAAAWAFMRACDAAEIKAGYPSLVASPYTVRVALEVECDCGVKSDDLADHCEECARFERYSYALRLANAASMVGSSCHHDGEEGRIVELRMMAEPMLAVEFAGGRVAVLRPTEIGARYWR